VAAEAMVAVSEQVENVSLVMQLPRYLRLGEKTTVGFHWDW